MDLRRTFVLANEFKEGDRLVGGANDAHLRHDARRLIAALRLGEIVPAALVDDGVTAALERSLNYVFAAALAPLTIAALKQILLSPGAASCVKDGGDRRTLEALRDEGAARIERLRARGYDIGYGHDADHAAGPGGRRIDAIYAHARQALYARLDPGVLRAVSPHHIAVCSAARDREEYLAHPPSGESIGAEDSARTVALLAARGQRPPQVQIVISDGLNANALNENLPAVLPPLRYALAAASLRVGAVDIVIQNGRVRAGYHAGALVDADAVVHLIGERPGTGLDTLSAYLTYGRDAAGLSRWSPDLDHASTTAVCGIHRHGKAPSEAVGEIARLLERMLERRRSGVVLESES